MSRFPEHSEAKRLKSKILVNKIMCKNNEIKTGIRKLDFVSYRGKMMVYLTDGRQILVPLSFFPDIKGLSVKDRSDWIILDDQFFTFGRLSKVYSIEDIMRLSEPHYVFCPGLNSGCSRDGQGLLLSLRGRCSRHEEGRGHLLYP